MPTDPYDFSAKYNTVLSPQEEAAFQDWATANNRQRDVYDYDIRGFWKSGGQFTPNGHGADTWKKPNHPTFSNQSIYSGVNGNVGGVWGSHGPAATFTPSATNLQNMGMEALKRYFTTVEPGNVLFSPWTPAANQKYAQGGLVTSEGPQMAMQTPQPMDTTSLDLPPALESLLNMGSIQTPVQPPSAGLSSALSTTAMTPMGSSQPMPSYQEGGMVGDGGAPIRPDLPSPAPAGGQPGLGPSAGGLSPQQIQMEAQRFVQRNPRQVQEIQMAIQQAMQSGELTQQELNTLVQMATVALQNPDMYPQLRNVAIQQGLATPQDISPQFDPGLLFTLIVVGQAMSSQGGAPQPQGQVGQPVAENPALMPAATQTGGVSSAEVGPMPSMAKGGELPAKSEPVPIMAHTGEYVIPAAVVRAKGTEFFDSLVAKYRGDRE